MTDRDRPGIGSLNGDAIRRVGVLDLNNGTANLGLRSILQAVALFGGSNGGRQIETEVFDVRAKGELPTRDFDVFISSGGPGSPYDDEGSRWESDYFRWLERVHLRSIPTLLICHSYELMVRFFGLAIVSERRSPSFGIFPVHPTKAAASDPVMSELEDPFFAADFRDWQVVEADEARFRELDAVILAREKIRPHVRLERAIMAVRVGEHILGVQFHPEASPEGMAQHFQTDRKMKQVVETYGKKTYAKMLALLDDPRALGRTHDVVIPRFLHHAFSPS
jgi:GMP synthase-like glutamine amidotransferase